MEAIAELIVANPAGVAVVIGLVVAGVVQLVKKALKIESGTLTWAKVGTAVTLAVLGSWAAQVVSGEGAIDIGLLIRVAVGAWLAAAGIHSTARAVAKTGKDIVPS